jgi:hypothetical protein
MPSFVISSIKTALVALLAARSGLAGVVVSNGYPGDSMAGAETVFTTDATGTDDNAAMRAGRTFYQETGEIGVRVWVKIPGGAPSDTEPRCEALATEVSRCVADNRTLGSLPGLDWIRLARWDQQSAYGETGAITEVNLYFTYHARLT